MWRRSGIVMSLAAIAVAACSGGVRPSRPVVSAAAPSAESPPSEGVDEAALDRAVSPCDDFYAFACGGWTRSTAVPDDEAVWVRSFGPIEAENDLALRRIVERAAKGDGQGDEEKKLGDFYASCMDEDAIAARGLAPIAAELAAIDAATDQATLARALARLHARGIFPLFSVGATTDPFDARKVALTLGPPSLGLPDRDDYLRDDDGHGALRARYREHVRTLLELAGAPPERAATDAGEVVAIEKALAGAALSGVAMRAPADVHHAMDSAALAALAPPIAWSAYLAALGIPEDAAIDAAQPDLLRQAGALAKTTPPGGLRAYLRVRLLEAMASSLDARFVAETDAMARATLGTPRGPARWKRCLRATEDAMGDALARRFVKETHAADGARSKVASMADGIAAALRAKIVRSPWLDRPTRERALAKLARMRTTIGYPEAWRRYDALEVDRASFAENRLRAAALEMGRVLARVGRPSARDEWPYSTTTPGAFYDPSRNEVVVPLGLLRPPMFAETTPAAPNYGAIGMVLGHELTHAFDDEGRLYDEQGELDAWWTPETTAAFDARARCVQAQVEGMGVNGRLTLGEDLADVGGLELAYAAFEADTARDAPARGGFDAEQAFFLGFAQAWCTVVRPEARRLRLATNAHAPAAVRVNAAAADMPRFAAAFGCGPASAMVRRGGCSVW